jgi:hypothetical protein
MNQQKIEAYLKEVYSIVESYRHYPTYCGDYKKAIEDLMKKTNEDFHKSESDFYKLFFVCHEIEKYHFKANKNDWKRYFKQSEKYQKEGIFDQNELSGSIKEMFNKFDQYPTVLLTHILDQTR